MKIRITKLACLSGAGLVAILAAQPALAKANGAETALGETTASNGGLDEIVVTAQKRTENAQNVPIAITALSARDIASTGSTNTENLRFGLLPG